MSSVPAKKMSEWTVPQGERERVLAAYMTDEVGYIAILLEGGSARFYDVTADLCPLVNLPVKLPVSGIAFRPRTQQWPGFEAALAFGEETISVLRYDLKQPDADPRKLFMSRGHSVAYSHDGSMIASGSTDGLLRVWRLHPEPREVLYLRDGQKCITSVSFDCNKKRLVYTTGCVARYVNLPDVVERKAVGDGEEEQKPVVQPKSYLKASRGSQEFDWDCYCVQTHPTREVVALGGYGSQVYYHDVGNGHPLQVIDTQVGKYVRDLRFIGQNQLLIVGQTGVELRNLDAQFSRVNLTQVKAPSAGLALAARQYKDTIYVARTSVAPRPVA